MPENVGEPWRALPGQWAHRKLEVGYFLNARECNGVFRTTMNMKTSLKVPGIAEFDVKRSLLEMFAINERANQKLLASVGEAAWRAAPPGGKGRTIAGIASHIHNVRLMWLAAADKSAKLPGKLNDEKVSRPDVMD